MIMNVEFAWLEVTNVELLATKRLGTPWTARFGSTTPSLGARRHARRADLVEAPADPFPDCRLDIVVKKLQVATAGAPEIVVPILMRPYDPVNILIRKA